MQIRQVIAKPRLRRMCRGCDEMFTPLGKYSRYCDRCLEDRKNKKWVASLKLRYQA